MIIFEGTIKKKEEKNKNHGAKRKHICNSFFDSFIGNNMTIKATVNIASWHRKEPQTEALSYENTAPPNSIIDLI